jgi:hypothetical protein
MGDDYAERTFSPDDDSEERANWPTLRPRPRPLRAPVSQWLPGAIILISVVIVVVADLLF